MDPQELLTRAVADVVPRPLAEQKLKSGKPLRIYLGFDPTGAKLHLGHSVPLRKLKAFVDAGHHVIFLIGSFTAMIGDPSGRDKMREPLTKEQVEANFQTYKKQASKILDFSKVELRYNHEWLEKLRFDDIARIGSNFTIQQMLQREMFQERLKRGDPLSPNEFLYPLMQGYDSVVLDVDCEIGGNDQLFNMLCGRTLQQACGKREKFVLTTKLIEGTDGRKMSKTYDNCIYLDEEPKEMFGKIMSIRDDLIALYMECCTDIPLKEIAEASRAMEKGANPKNYKVRLAEEIVTLYHGRKEAAAAKDHFERVFSKGEAPEKMEEAKVAQGTLVIEVLIKKGIVPSKSDARRIVEQGGLKMNDVVVKDPSAPVEEGIVRVGKRRFLRITILKHET